MIPFTHLHVHSQYSLLDGKASVQELVDKAIADGMRGIALTDHGNMFGIKEFFNYVNKKNSGKPDEEKFKPILGCEMYVAREKLTDKKDKSDNGYHLIVLAKNSTGYHNLIKLVSKAWTCSLIHICGVARVRRLYLTSALPPSPSYQRLRGNMTLRRAPHAQCCPDR